MALSDRTGQDFSLELAEAFPEVELSKLKLVANLLLNSIREDLALN